MNTVNGSFKSGHEVSLSIYSTNMSMHRNAKCNWTKLDKYINGIKQNNTQLTTAASVSLKKKKG